MIRSVLAVIAGFAAATITFMFVQAINGLLFTPPSTIDYNDPNAVASLMAAMPIGAFLILAAGYALGSFLAGWLVQKMLRSRSLVFWSLASAVDLIVIGMMVVVILVSVSLFQGLPGMVKTLLPFFIIGVAIIGGVFLGRTAAGSQSRSAGVIEAAAVGVLLTAAWVMGVTSIPHPAWMVVLGFFCFIPFVLLGNWAASQNKPDSADEQTVLE